MDKQFKRAKKGAVELTSLLDLLFVMIFVSLLQQKEVTPPPVAKTETKVVEKIVEKIVEVEKIIVKEPKPEPAKIESITGVFFFKGVSLPYQGKFSMRGFVNNETGTVNLGTVAWIEKPTLKNKNIEVDMVSLSGKLSEDKLSIQGRVDYIGCKEFKISKVSGSSTSVAGEWKGTYICGQGATKLNLTIAK